MDIYIYVGFMDIYMHIYRLIGHLIATDNGYKIVLPPEFKYLASASYYILATVLVPGV